MILLLKKNISIDQKRAVLASIQNLGYEASVQAVDQTEAVFFTETQEVPFDFSNMEGVAKVIASRQEYPLTSLKTNPVKTKIQVGPYYFGPSQVLMIAGPCSIESEEQALSIAYAVKKAGAHILRGGAYKPRTSPYSFQGLGQEGLHILNRVKKAVQMPVITELMDARDLQETCEVADILQIGTRNMQNFSLLKEVGKVNKPILLKRGISATIKEWLLSAEYILNQGNPNVILCERGIRSFDSETRNLLDLSAVSLVKQLSHLPVIVDPSHALGRRDLIEPMSLAAIAAGADGLMIEVHDEPHKALSDGAQALSYSGFEAVISKVKKIAGTFDLSYP